jgi:hypothetical protein
MGETDVSPEENASRVAPSTPGILARHRRLGWAVTGLVVGLVAFTLVWFQPQKLLLNQRVDEALPLTSPSGGSTPPASSPKDGSPGPSAPGSSVPAGPNVLVSGGFRSLEHQTTGRASVIRLGDGRRYLRFENLSTSNGPDLHVYLSEVPAGPDLHAYGVHFVDLGKLKGNIGNQNYSLPDGIDLSKYRSAVIWCKRFSVGFGVAPLT